ncbi:hypothetical protein CF319_g6182 [Tilletia indica]|nr:hypothetical protein CF319_g6182 [Tilletia indica]
MARAIVIKGRTAKLKPVKKTRKKKHTLVDDEAGVSGDDTGDEAELEGDEGGDGNLRGFVVRNRSAKVNKVNLYMRSTRALPGTSAAKLMMTPKHAEVVEDALRVFRPHPSDERGSESSDSSNDNLALAIASSYCIMFYW